MHVIIDGNCRFCLGSTKLLRRMLAVQLHVITQYDLEYADFQNRFMKRLWKEGIDTHIMIGNHDTYYKNTNEVNSPDLLLREYTNINVIDHPATIYIDDVPICMMPWICPENYQDSIDTMKDTKAEICMGHFEIAGFAMYRGMESHEGMGKEVFDKFDMVFSGHYHHRSSDGHIHYLGNPYELTWQDYNDTRGFHLFDLETRKLQFIANPYTMFERLEYNDKEVEPINLDELELKDTFVKLVVVNKKDNEMFDRLLERLYSDISVHELKILEDYSDLSAANVSDDVVEGSEDTMNLVSNYVDQLKVDLDKDRLKVMIKEMYIEAQDTDAIK